VRLSELMCLMEDEWLICIPQPAPQTGLQIMALVTQARYGLLQKVTNTTKGLTMHSLLIPYTSLYEWSILNVLYDKIHSDMRAVVIYQESSLI
jgi:hypothetical protein